jgi:hypothetical protein
MKTRFPIKHICLMVLIAGVLAPDVGYAQPKPRLTQPPLIPGRNTRSVAPAGGPPGAFNPVAPTPTPAAAVPTPVPSPVAVHPAPAPAGAVAAPVPAVPAGAIATAPVGAPVPAPVAQPDVPAAPPIPLEELFFAEDTRTRGAPELTFIKPEGVVGKSSRKNEQREEMFARMRLAVEGVAAEYGNPTFAEFFTNDALRAKVFRQRLQLLRNYDKLQSELVELRLKKEFAAQDAEQAVREQQARVKNALASLEQEKQLLAADVAAKRDELNALQEQANTLSAKIKQAQVTLNSIQIK